MLVQSEEWEPAAASLGRLTELIPGDGAAWHNLAMVFVQLGKTNEAVSALRQSLRVRPRAVHTRECLQQLVHGGRFAA
jgi:Flp pilus assembly protein TadD